jgi:prepilin-type N-terminal cleavage/methylation domain-containing protein
MRDNKHLKHQSAFTLIETLIALVILLVGLLAVAQLFIAATYSNFFAQNTTLELKALESSMEDLTSIIDWDVTTNPTRAPRIAVGGTVVMEGDGGGLAAAGLPATSTTGPDKAHIKGVVLNPVLNVAGRLLYFTPEIIDVTSTKWPQRKYEIRWQVIGYNAANPFAPPSTLVLTDAYSCGTCSTNPTPNFASMISSPTPPKDGLQTSVYVIMRVAPIAQDPRITSRLQIATLINNPQ